jgi:hypothetical protein
MENQNGYLFTLELRIRKQIAKLNVYEEDSLNDLILRLSKTVQYKEKYSERLKEKLEGEFKKLLSTQDCSEKVKSKLESLTEESKLIIIGVSETEKNDQSLNETPFKILLESSLNMRKFSAENVKKQYSYENFENGGSPLIRKYNKKSTPEANYDNRAAEENMGLKYQYPSNSNFAFEAPNQQESYKVLEDKINLREYSPIVNINSKRSMKSNYDNRMQLDIIAEEEERIRKEGCIRKFSTLAPQDKGELNYKESFHDYKIQKNKSQSTLGRMPNLETMKRNYVSNQEDILIPRGQNKLVYNQNQEALTKIDYSTKYLEGKATVGARGSKKFSYLS